MVHYVPLNQIVVKDLVDLFHAMQGETPKRRIQRLREECQRKLRELRVQLGENLLRSRGIAPPAKAADRERMAQIEAYKDPIRSKTRELEDWAQCRDRAAKRGIAKQARFRQQMIAGMEKQLERYKEELRRLQSFPAHSGPVPPNPSNETEELEPPASCWIGGDKSPLCSMPSGRNVQWPYNLS